MTNKQQPKI